MKTKFFLVIAIAYAAWHFIFKSNDDEVPAYKPTAAIAPYGMRGVDYSWPGVSAPDQQLTANKLAKNYYIVFDGSGSMDEKSCESSDKKINVAKQALSSFFQTLPADVNVGIFLFDNNGAGEVLPISPLNTDKLNQVVQKIWVGGGTPLGESLRQGYLSLSRQALSQQGYGEYNLVVITDGEASDGETMNKMVDQISQQSSISIHTLGFCLSGQHALNVKGLVNYISANSAQQLLDGLNDVAAESDSFDISAFNGV